MKRVLKITDKDRTEALEAWTILLLEHPWLFGASFTKRAFAIWGYGLAALGCVYGVLFILGLIIGLGSY